MPNMIYSLALSKFLQKQEEKLVQEIDDLIEFTHEDFEKAKDFNQDTTELSHNVLLL